MKQTNSENELLRWILLYFRKKHFFKKFIYMQTIAILCIFKKNLSMKSGSQKTTSL